MLLKIVAVVLILCCFVIIGEVVFQSRSFFRSEPFRFYTAPFSLVIGVLTLILGVVAQYFGCRKPQGFFGSRFWFVVSYLSIVLGMFVTEIGLIGLLMLRVANIIYS